jgi:predicted nucleic acid-binding protein
MTLAYFDSSVLLAILLDQPSAPKAKALWKEHKRRVSSILFEAECLITLRRAASQAGPKLPKGWLAEKTEFLDSRLQEITIHQVDATILSHLRHEAGLADCRTADALHLATARYVEQYADAGLVVITFDERMRATAKRLKMTVIPG